MNNGGLDVAAGVGFELQLGTAAKKDFGDLLDSNWRKRFRTPFRLAATGTTDATGFVEITLPVTPEGKFFYITSLVQWADGKTPATVYATAAAWFAYYYGTNPSVANFIDGGPSTVGGTIFPNRNTYAEEVDPILPGGEAITFVLHGDAAIASTNITIIASGLLGDYVRK